MSTNDDQFGFKKKHDADMSIHVLKQVIAKYQALNSCLFVCFLDGSKVFDRVNRTVLELIDRDVAGYIVRISVCCYGNQQMCLRWRSRV